MILAFIFLSEPVGLITVVGMIFMGIGTWLMLELKKGDIKDNTGKKSSKKSWLFFAVLAAVFASLTAIFGRIGVADIEANLWTAIRTVVVVPLSWIMVFMVGSQKQIKNVDRKSWIFLILSGVATGSSWLFFYHALQIGNASSVVPIDKLSIVLTMGFARLFLAERFSKQSLIGLGLLAFGTLLPVFLG
jgi:transporter family protein